MSPIPPVLVALIFIGMGYYQIFAEQNWFLAFVCFGITMAHAGIADNRRKRNKDHK